MRIYALTGVFRNRERTALHAPEFTMLEWYRTGAPLERLIEDCVAVTALAAHIAEREEVRVSSSGGKSVRAAGASHSA